MREIKFRCSFNVNHIEIVQLFFWCDRFFLKSKMLFENLKSKKLIANQWMQLKNPVHKHRI